MKKKVYVVTLALSVRAENPEDAKEQFWEDALEDKFFLDLDVEEV